jgi:predicted Fe-Mo cluster-binding NifX family protein
MTIAIPSCGEGWDAEVEERFGRAKGFFLIDSESGATRFIQNMANADAEHGAGTGAVQMLVHLGIDAVLAGRVGPKAADALNAAGITYVALTAGRTVAEAWNTYKREIPTP